MSDEKPTENVLEFVTKPKEETVPLLVGPFTEWHVMVDGRIIPRLTGFHDGDKIALVVDHRFSASFSPEDAYQAAWLIAQGMAISEGYPHLGATSKKQPFAPQGTLIDMSGAAAE